MSETTFGLVEPLRDRPPGSVGKPRLHPDTRIQNDVRVLDEAGQRVGPGEVGELVIRNAMIMKGYFGEPGLTEEAIRGGYLFTGDYASVDEDGFYYFVDRKKDIVRRRGENVSSLEVELTLLDHPDVEEAAVIGVPAELTEEEVLAFVVIHADHPAAPESLRQWCADRLADYKVPRFIQIVGSLPKTATQKVEKAQLRAHFVDPDAWYDHEASKR
jgi:crotonobetaine/carnitine-CoA ligase